MNILAIGSKVKCVGVKFSGGYNKYFVQSFKVENVSQVPGWRIHSLCTHMFAISSHKLGLSW